MYCYTNKIASIEETNLEKVLYTCKRFCFFLLKKNDFSSSKVSYNGENLIALMTSVLLSLLLCPLQHSYFIGYYISFYYCRYFW